MLLICWFTKSLILEIKSRIKYSARKYYFDIFNLFLHEDSSFLLRYDTVACYTLYTSLYLRPILRHSRASPLRRRTDQIYLHRRVQGVVYEPPRLCLVMPRCGRTSSIASRVNSPLRITRLPHVCARSTGVTACRSIAETKPRYTGGGALCKYACG